jgi:hypothetical protein
MSNIFTSILIKDEFEIEYMGTHNDREVRVAFRAIKNAEVPYTSPYSGFVGLGPESANNFMS